MRHCNINNRVSHETPFSMMSYRPARDVSPDCITELYLCHWKNTVEATVLPSITFCSPEEQPEGHFTFCHPQQRRIWRHFTTFLSDPVTVLHYTILHSALATARNFVLSSTWLQSAGRFPSCLALKILASNHKAHLRCKSPLRLPHLFKDSKRRMPTVIFKTACCWMSHDSHPCSRSSLHLLTTLLSTLLICTNSLPQQRVNHNVYQ